MSKFTEDFNPTEEQKANLLKLADVLEAGLPTAEGYSFEFDMDVYFNDLNKDHCFSSTDYIQHLHKQCDSSACALGVGIISDIGSTSKFIHICHYARDTFGTDEDVTHEGQFMFSAFWSSVDNTPQGAAARIRYVLNHGLPEDWEEQMNGDEPISYMES